MVTFVTYNTNDYERFAAGETEDTRSRQTEEGRYRLLEEAVGDIAPDVIALQELPGHNQTRANRALAQLSDITGMRCIYKKSRGLGDAEGYAVTPGNTANLGMGLMWRDGIEPIVDSWRVERHGFWHALASIALDVGARHPVRHAVGHMPPAAGAGRRIDEAKQIVKILVGQSDTPFALLGIDQNSMGEDTAYDPLPTLPHFTAEEIARRHVDDRGPAKAFTAGGLIDAAHWLDVGQYRRQQRERNAQGQPLAGIRGVPTTGHRIDPQYGMANYGARRIDIVRATHGMLPALTGYRVRSDIPNIYDISDHLPVAVTYDERML